MKYMKKLAFAFLCLTGLMTLATSAQAAKILILTGYAASTEPSTTTDITANLQATCFPNPAKDTVTVIDSLPAPAALSSYDEIWDLRFSNASVLTAADQSAYTAYLQAGGRMFVMGENGSFMTRDTSIFNWVNALGGGTLTSYNGYLMTPETVQSPYNTTPNALTTVTFAAADGVSSPGTGKFITTDGTNGGSAVMWPTGTLANAKAGSLAVVFDVNFMQANPPSPDGNPAFLQNLCAAVRTGGYAAPTTAPSAIPVGGGLWGPLLALGIAALGALGWRRKARA